MAEINIQNKRINPINQKESVSKSMKDYNNASTLQLKIIEDGIGNIQAAVPLLPSHNGTFQIADFGCSEGRNSMFLIRQLLNELQTRKDYTKEIKKMVVYHEDLPDNNFEALKDCVMNPELGYPFHELVKANGIETKTECIGKTYYEQIVEPSSIDIAFCYNSLHWMPEYRPTPYGLTYDAKYGDKELTKWFDNLADKSLCKWLDLRHEELKKGGLVSFNILTESVMVDWMNDSWTRAFSKKGLNHRDFDKVNVPIYRRDPLKLLELLSKYSNKFNLIRCETLSDDTKINRAGIRAAFYNQITVGLSKYKDVFPTEASVKEFYELVENEFFDNSNDVDPGITCQWVVLQKV